ncbi:MAG: HTH cro/C1-type domain-containing protein [Oscillospiraceae bacterium]|jgi:transcriptional regulator with XRE-family HTH domain
MYEIDNEKFGTFLVQLRKQKGFTQKELAQKLFVSDKAVSKWERGLSMPDIALLAPLAKLLDVTITELLSGQYIREPEHMSMQDVENVVSGTLKLSAKEEEKRRRQRKWWGTFYFACVLIVFLECALLYLLDYSSEQIVNHLGLVEFLSLLFGGWFCLFAKETLPAYYDENKIHYYSDGIFRMNIAFVHFNNSNWPHILNVTRTWFTVVSVVFPMIYLTVSSFFPLVWNFGKLYITLFSVLGFLIPLIVVGKRYE